jgi:hypothetical protein
MSFLDNSGDIILDAVLTDAGRERLARGDGSFKIVKFALGDDEINYENYNGTDLRGSAFYDLEILQTPVLEAFTNNTSNMKSKLITITRTNILYLPIMLLNSDTSMGGGVKLTTSATYGEGIIPVSVDNTTTTDITITSFIDGSEPGTSNGIVIDQGLDTNALQPSNKIPEDLYESQYQIQMDNRLLSLTGQTGTSATVSFVDDDSIASYTVPNTFIEDITDRDKAGQSPIVGPRGSRLKFDLKASLDTQSGTYLFTTLGAELNDGTNNYYYIDTTVRVTGLTTGNSMDLPVRLLKRKL